MAIFEKTPIQKACDYISKNANIRINENDIKDYLVAVNNNEDLFISIISTIIMYTNQPLNRDNFITAMDKFCFIIYPLVVKSEEDNNFFLNVCKRYFSDKNISSPDFLNKVYVAFNDKNIVLEVFDYLRSFLGEIKEDYNANTKNNIGILLEYLIEARQYYVDDRALYSSFINLVNKVGKEYILYSAESAEIENKIAKKIAEDKKANGIYDIDQETLEEYGRMLESLGIRKEEVETLLDLAARAKIDLGNIITTVERKIKDAGSNELRQLQQKGEQIFKEHDSKYNELLTSEREGLVSDREAFVAEFEKILDDKRAAAQEYIETISKTIKVEIAKIPTTANREIQRITDYVNTDGNIQKLIEEHQKSQDFLKHLENISESIGQSVANATTPSIVTTEGVPGVVVAAQVDNGDNAPVDYTINYYFDKTKKYKERFKTLMDRKAELEAAGEIFHEKFDDICAMLIQNESPYLWGPSGCGKTYLVEKQISQLFDERVVTGGFVNFEQDVIGFVNVGSGQYVPSIFYRGYKYGNMMFYDEIDKSNPNGANILLPFMNRSKDQRYTFPNGISVPRHPNFRIITAGNTKLSGNTVAYNTSRKLDESINQRVMFVHLDYDNRIEMRILKDFDGWYEFCVKFRNALEHSGSSSYDDKNSLGTITSRDAQSIRDHLTDNSLSDEKLMEYHVIENKDVDYLSKITANLEKESFETKDGKRLRKLYNNMVRPRIEAYDGAKY